MSSIKFFAVLTPGRMSPLQAFELVETVARANSGSDEETAFKEAKRKIKRRGTEVLPIVVGTTEFDFAEVVHKKLEWVSLTGSAIDPALCTRLAKELFRSGSLVMAVILDRDYDYWQNAEDPLQYRAAGRSWNHLPTRSNGLPPPLNQEVIDISDNPGRRFVKLGFFEIVAYRMWLTDSFWTLTGADKAGVRNAPGLVTKEEIPGLLELEAGQKCFTSPEGEERRMQDHLRNVLFGANEQQFPNGPVS